MSRSELVLIAAVARNGSIGRANQLLFRDPADQAHFRHATTGSPVIMGRLTWESLPPRFRPLPQRRNIVVTRNADYVAAGAETAPSLDAALQTAAQSPRVFVIGGAQLYAQALPRADRLMLTEIDADLDGDRFFPAWRRGDFVETERESRATADGVRFDFVSYRRR